MIVVLCIVVQQLMRFFVYGVTVAAAADAVFVTASFVLRW